MGSSYISCMDWDKEPKGFDLYDDRARVLYYMAGLELLADFSLGEWAALAGRDFIWAAMHAATDQVDPGMDKHNHDLDRLRALRNAFAGALGRLEEYGEWFPGRYLQENRILDYTPPLGQAPTDLPAEELRMAARRAITQFDEVIQQRLHPTK